jgi:hypothetical protein
MRANLPGTALFTAAIVLMGLLAASPAHSVTIVLNTAGTGTLGGAPNGAFDTCLVDNSTGNLLQWNSTTGQYKFTRCSDGFMITGTGVAKLVNGIRTLTDFKSDRRISAGFNTGQLTGNATLYLRVAGGVWQSFQIVDTNPHAVCVCPLPA